MAVSSNCFRLCHSQSSFGVLAHCSQFPKPSGIWFLTSLHEGQLYSLCCSMPSSLLQPLHFFLSDQPMSFHLFCTQPPSSTSLLHMSVLLSVQDSVVCLRSVPWIGPSHPPSFSSSHSRFAAHFFQQTVQARIRTIFFYVLRERPLSCPPLLAPRK